MATSGSTVFELTRDEIIAAALRKLVVYGDGQTATTTQTVNAAQALNAMLKTFQTDGMPLWAIKEYNFPLTATGTYQIGIGKTLATPMPLKIIQAEVLTTSSGQMTEMNIYTHRNFNLLGSTLGTGYPVNLMYEPLGNYGIINIWPIPDATTIASNTITITYQRPFEEFVAATDTPDFPSYWTEALIYGLAWRLAPEFGVPVNDATSLGKSAEMFRIMAKDFGGEEGSLYFQVDREGH